MSKAHETKLADPLQEVADEIGYDALVQKLTNTRGVTKYLKGDYRCIECRRHITYTNNYGEVGHKYNCSRRETEYKGRLGRRLEDNFGDGDE